MEIACEHYIISEKSNQIMNADIALFLLRIMAGISFLVHGWPKLANWKGTFEWLMKEKFPLPLISTLGVCLGEVFGGTLLILGIGVQYVAWLLAFIMLVATFYKYKKDKSYVGTAELPALLFVICIALAIAGGGAWQIAP